MAADESRALIARYVDALNTRSIEGVLNLLGEDVILDPYQGTRRIGRPDVERYLIERARRFRETVSDLVVLVSDDGARAAAEYSLRGTYQATEEGLPPATGQSFSLSAGSFFEIEDGLFVRITLHLNGTDLASQLSRS